MKIYDLVIYLAAQDPSKRLPLGFRSPHLVTAFGAPWAFEPRYNITLGDLLQSVR